MHRRQRGFTLVQLLVALAILAILMALASAAVGAAGSAARSAEVRAGLHTALLAAERAALLRGRNVVLCSTGGGGSCAGSRDWHLGYMAFDDRNGDRQRQPDEQQLLAVAGWTHDVRLRSSSGRTRIVMQPQGGAAAGSNVTFVLCDGRGPAKAAALVLANSGRLRQDRPSAARLATDCPGD